MTDSPRKPPPPPPPGARKPGAANLPLPAPRGVAAPAPPSLGERASEAVKEHVVEQALGLLEEQVQARIVHYKADLETNPELDAITAGVVAELKQLQQQLGSVQPHVEKGKIQDQHVKTLRGLLERIFRADAPTLMVEKRLKEIHRKLARLFFQSELHEKTRGKDGTLKVIQHGEQAIFYLLARYDHRLKNELGFFDFANDEVKERSFDLLAKISKDMQDAFLSRRSSELKHIVQAFHATLIDFLVNHLAPSVPELAREAIEQGKTFEGPGVVGYKIHAEAFGRFRAAFERRLMVRLVGVAEDQLLAKLADTAGAAREETVRFVTDPHVFSMIVGELCDGIYEFLCNEGFLDLPLDWRQAAALQRST